MQAVGSPITETPHFQLTDVSVLILFSMCRPPPPKPRPGRCLVVHVCMCMTNFVYYAYPHYFVFIQVEHNTNAIFAPQGSVPIQAAEIEAPIIVQQTDANSAVRRPSTPLPNQRR